MSWTRRWASRCSSRAPNASSRRCPSRATGSRSGCCTAERSVAFAEALGSWAAVIHARSLGKTAVGLDINATHHAPARSGIVTGVATAIRLGRTATSHEIVVTDDQGRRLCTARITNLMVDEEPRPLRPAIRATP